VAIVERDPLPRIPMRTRQELHDWLAEHHAGHRGFWLEQWRPHTGRTTIPYEDVVEECLIFGWIDSTVRTYDDERNGLRLTPRKPNSVWSAPNMRRIERLEAAGLMHPAERRAVEAARSNGMYNFLDDVEALVVPDDLAAALGEHREAFDALPAGRRKQVLYWIKSAKRDSTRRDRIAKVVRAAPQGRAPV
jgi:uncharacterized protein YdeI (YjbR/CyaY-like superfamily)